MEKKRTKLENKKLEKFEAPKVETIKIEDSNVISTSGGCCILQGTAIILGDGVTKKVEDLRFGDQILAFNFFNGKFESTPLLYTFVQNGNADKFDITLENGIKVTILNDEDMFDINKREFFTINKETYKNAIGITVLVNNNCQIGFSKIVDIKYERKQCSFYTLYSKKVLNYVANNVVLMYANNGFSQRYTVDNSFKIDLDAYNNDVKNYGLFSYDDLPDLTREMFDDFDVASSKFLIGKGYITKEEFNKFMNDFISEYNTKKPLFINK